MLVLSQHSAEQMYFSAGERSIHFLSLSQTDQNYEILLKTRCWKQVVENIIFKFKFSYQGKNANWAPSLKGAVYAIMSERRCVLLCCHVTVGDLIQIFQFPGSMKLMQLISNWKSRYFFWTLLTIITHLICNPLLYNYQDLNLHPSRHSKNFIPSPLQLGGRQVMKQKVM